MLDKSWRGNLRRDSTVAFMKSHVSCYKPYAALWLPYSTNESCYDRFGSKNDSYLQREKVASYVPLFQAGERIMGERRNTTSANILLLSYECPDVQINIKDVA
jgi:hypothetical protein